MSTNTDAFLNSVLAFAERMPSIRAVVLTGSRARIGAVVDEWSDYDIEFICRDPGELEEGDEWIEELGQVLTCRSLFQDEGYATRLALFASGKKADFTLASTERIDRMVADGLNDLFQRGYRVLLDKDCMMSGMSEALGIGPNVKIPSEEQFLEAVEEFWFEAAHIPKYLSRDELWVVKFRDWTMKEQLLKLLEWSTTLTGDSDTWHIGTQMKSWVSPESWQELQAVFGSFGVDDSLRAFLATTTLFQRLEKEICKKREFQIPPRIIQLEEQVSRAANKLQSSASLRPHRPVSP